MSFAFCRFLGDFDIGKPDLGPELETRKLQEAWSRAKEQWRDAAAQSFYEDNLADLDADVRNAMSALRTLSGLMQSARSECG